MDQVDGSQPPECSTNISSRRTLRRVTPSSAEEVHSRPRVGDIWVPISMPTANHFPRIYIPGVEDLFQTGDCVLRIEHGGSRSRLICWRVWRDAGGSWQFQLESSDEQDFSLIPSVFSAVPLRPVYEGEQATFQGRNNI
ncbi:unnamed protein product [Sphagnum troendelagicum]|jgi:hypothetical protein